jgi:hypothetical protein
MELNGDRVRAHTAAEVLRRIDGATTERLKHYAAADGPAVERRLRELDQEWDTDRAIELEASAMAITGLLLGMLVRRSLLAIPAVVGGAVLLHALTGRYPLLPAFRRMGVRTGREIEAERYALKALRGDFSDMPAQAGDAAEAGIAVPTPSAGMARL